jgi:parvulin-like peptidyl-prolyl isomerase
LRKTRKEQPKRRVSRGEREKRRRSILLSVIVVVIIAALALIGWGYYDTYVKPWQRDIARVNDRVFGMHYYVKMLRLYGAGQSSDPTSDFQLAYNVVTVIQNNELVRQEAEKLGITVDRLEVVEETKSYLNFDPDEENMDQFDKRIDDALRRVHLSRADFEEMFIVPMVLQQKLQEYVGNGKYPEGQLFQHVRVQALLLGTQEQASAARSKWEGGEAFSQLITEFSPSRYYPKDSVEWLPWGIESYVFNGFAFAEGSENRGISGAMLRDTAYSTKGGYWLVEVLDTTGVGQQMKLHLRSILVDSEATANELRDKITAGEDFATLAKEHSLHTSSQANGGDMGSLSLSDVESQFGTQNLNTILALGLKNLSQPFYQAEISKDSGYWLIKVLDKEKRTLSDDNRSTLVSEAFKEWFENAPSAEGIRVESYIDYSRISWALRHV